MAGVSEAGGRAMKRGFVWPKVRLWIEELEEAAAKRPKPPKPPEEPRK